VPVPDSTEHALSTINILLTFIKAQHACQEGLIEHLQKELKEVRNELYHLQEGSLAELAAACEEL